MTRIIGAIIVGSTLILAAYAAASGLGVQGGVLQAGETGNLTCQTNTQNVTIEYQTAWVGANKLVTHVKAGQIDGACSGKNIQIDLIDANNFHLGSASGKVSNGVTDWLEVTPGPGIPKVGTVANAFVTIGDVQAAEPAR